MSAALQSRRGAAGLALLFALAAASAASLAAYPADSAAVWDDPEAWLDNPRAAEPAWAAALSGGAAAHSIIESPPESRASYKGLHAVSHRFAVDPGAGIPGGFVYEYAAAYEGAALLRLHAEGPGGGMILASRALPEGSHAGRIFSDKEAAKTVFAGGGERVFVASLYSAGPGAVFERSKLVVGGGAHGMMGTDDRRRDLAEGLLRGAAPALFIGITVAAASVSAGMLYGAWAGYRGGATDRMMSAANDVAYALPALPFLVILSVSFGGGLFLTAGFLALFGWVGVAKVARSMALQERGRGWVEAARLAGRRDFAIVRRHVLPQMLPYAMASVAISVPAAITAEAGLSFLGLGDPSQPSWGRMLHDAADSGAAARGMWWQVAPPGAAIAAAGLAFVLLGGAMEGGRLSGAPASGPPPKPRR